MAETPSELQAEIEKLERKHAENPEGRYFVPLANAYRKLGQIEAAESLLREGLRRHPEYLSAHIVLGRCLADRAALDEAAGEFRYVLSLDPQNLIALRSLGELAISQGHPDEAGRWYRELLTADPMNDEARRALDSLQTASAVEASPPAPAEEPEGYGGFVDVDGPVSREGDSLPLLEGEDEGEDPELVTETIAELYARQGLFGRAAEVYRELIRLRGGDAALQRRLEEVERLADGGAPAPAAPGAPDPDPVDDPFAASFADGFQAQEPEPGPEADLEPEQEPWPEPDLAPEPEPFVLLEPEPEPEPAAVEEPDAVVWPEPEPASGGPSIAEFLAGLAAWSPSAAPPSPPVTAAEEEPAPADAGTGSAGEEPFPWELSQSEPTASPAETGEPDFELEREALLSYEDYLGGAEEPRAEAVGAEEEAAPSATETETETPSTVTSEDDDLESFQAWLRSLKR
jgi:tetratricopeptide (TPR) repeat protein